MPRSCRLSLRAIVVGVELGVLTHDRLNGVDVMGDQIRRHLVEIRRVFDDAAQALGGNAGGGKTKRCGVAFDVMGGAKQLLAVIVGEAVAENRGMSRREPVGLDRHPVLEFTGQSGQRLFRAADGIVEVGFGNAQQYLAQGIRLRDHMMIAEGFDFYRSRASFRHDGFLDASALDAGSGLVEQ